MLLEKLINALAERGATFARMDEVAAEFAARAGGERASGRRLAGGEQ